MEMPTKKCPSCFRNITLNKFSNHKVNCRRNFPHKKASNKNRKRNKILRKPMINQFQLVKDTNRQTLKKSSGKNRTNLFGIKEGRRERLENYQRNKRPVSKIIVDETGSKRKNRNLLRAQTRRSNSHRQRTHRPNNINVLKKSNRNHSQNNRRKYSRDVVLSRRERKQSISEDVLEPGHVLNKICLYSQNKIDQLPEPTNNPNQRCAKQNGRNMFKQNSKARRRDIKQKLPVKRKKGKKKINKKPKRKNTTSNLVKTSFDQMCLENQKQNNLNSLEDIDSDNQKRIEQVTDDPLLRTGIPEPNERFEGGQVLNRSELDPSSLVSGFRAIPLTFSPNVCNNFTRKIDQPFNVPEPPKISQNSESQITNLKNQESQRNIDSDFSSTEGSNLDSNRLVLAQLRPPVNLSNASTLATIGLSDRRQSSENNINQDNNINDRTQTRKINAENLLLQERVPEEMSDSIICPKCTLGIPTLEVIEHLENCEFGVCIHCDNDYPRINMTQHLK